MYLLDSNILRHFWAGQPIVQLHFQRVSLLEIALPSVVVAEVLKGRTEFALKATPTQAPLAHQHLIETWRLLQAFNIIIFNAASATAMLRLQEKISSRKRYADVMIAAMALAGQHIVVTRNQNHFADLLPARQLENWVDAPPR